jgi:hypothetical protein
MGLPYEIFPSVPDFTDPPKYGVSNLVDRAGLSAAIDTAFFPQTFPDLTFQFQFAFSTAEDSRELKTFFRRMGGKLRPFYVPSWRSDLPCGPGADDAGTAGDTKISVFCEDYAATYLDSTDPDHFGRQLFVWQPGEDLFTAAVVSSEQLTQGHAVLTVSRYLPFTIDPTTAIIGFLHLAHFNDDEIMFNHMTTAAATSEAKFRAQREFSAEILTLAIAQIDRSPFLGFDAAAQVSDAAIPADNRIAYADTFNAWANSDGIRLAAGDPYDVALPDGSGSLSGLAETFIDTEHISLSWDADGEHVLAWQSSETEFTVGVGPSDPILQTFTGLDPLLCTNLNVDGSIGGGEQTNAVYYRKPADTNLYMRIGPAFGTEYVAAALPVRPIKLKRIFEDLEARTLTLEYLDAQFRTTRITSAAYPEA